MLELRKIKLLVMNSFGRTPSNKERLKLKGFHRRNIIVGVEGSLLDCDVKPLPINPGSGSGGSGEKSDCFTYHLESIKKYWSGHTAYKNWYKRHTTETFNKFQLIGKVILIYGVRYRIISKAL